ncbi:M20/M25/M40 family metallo-hydrolase [Qingshengfaniella alkalisoli]|uniref:M20/M25/M40 family metallo-hydrolase n=1 Tax=Qingshengfaniella alkalisoli TaxID=2599296 RepID=A0A5B8J0Q1_9RHOB|nr:M20/M25/M40 family metallo-hydrolase [Qingshengfaniella alkalisoli]QDY70751.1 M20/M25/M40 family metallo-hydrolase [Qingshengfaniella alkalisoli]
MTDPLLDTLRELLAIPSPTGMTDDMADMVADRLSRAGLAITRSNRGAVRARWDGQSSRRIGISAHLDTLGAMIGHMPASGRPELLPIGTWSARFAEGARASVFTRTGDVIRGTILPRRASGHRYGNAVDKQPTRWDNLELRLDTDDTATVTTGDYVALDPGLEITPNGFINARYLDNKAGIACLLSAIEQMKAAGDTPKHSLDFLFPVTEETGTGASHMADGLDDLIALDIAIIAPEQASHPTGVTLIAMDSGGPYDRKLTASLRRLCERDGITHSVDVLRHYYSDTYPATLSGADIRCAAIGFACDASHGWERTTRASLTETTRLLTSLLRNGLDGD